MDSVQGISQRSSGGRGPSTGNSVCLCVTHVKSVWLVEVSSSKAWTVMPTLISPSPPEYDVADIIYPGERDSQKGQIMCLVREETDRVPTVIRTFSGMKKFFNEMSNY